MTPILHAIKLAGIVAKAAPRVATAAWKTQGAKNLASLLTRFPLSNPTMRSEKLFKMAEDIGISLHRGQNRAMMKSPWELVDEIVRVSKK